MTHAEAAAVFERRRRAWVAGDIDAYLALWHPDVEFASPMHVVAFTYPFNLSGHPACTVRAGFTAEGLPVGLQLVAERGREDIVLQAARAYERLRPFDGWPTEPRVGS